MKLLAIEKPTLQDIRKQAKTQNGRSISRQELAELAGLTPTDLYVIDIGGYCPLQNIQKVLRIFNALSGQHITINDIRHRGVPVSQ